MGLSVYPRVDAYLRSLPDGIDSHPTCGEKASIVHTWIAASPPLRHAELLPPAARRLLEVPPAEFVWVPVVHANALYLAIADEHFPDDDAYVAFCRDNNATLLRSSRYRTIVNVATPRAFLLAAKIGFQRLHRGTTMAISQSSPSSIAIRVSWPASAWPRLLAAALGTAWEVGVEETRLVRSARTKLESFSEVGAAYDVSWT